MKRFAFTFLIYHCVFFLHDNVLGFVSYEMEINNSNSPTNAEPVAMNFEPSAVGVSLRNAFAMNLYHLQNTNTRHRPRNRTSASTAVKPPVVAAIIAAATTAACTTATPGTTVATGAACITTATVTAATTTTTTTTTVTPAAAAANDTANANCTTANNGTDPDAGACDDVVQLFKFGDKLAVLSLEQKVAAVFRLTGTCYAVLTQTPPPVMVIDNLVRMFAYTDGLFAAVCGPALDDVLVVVTSGQCGGRLSATPWDVRARFVEGTLSLSPGFLYRAPRPAVAAVLQSAAAAACPPALPRAAAANLVTALALSPPLFYGLSPAALEWTLRAAADHADLLARLPASTAAAFLDGALRTTAPVATAAAADGRLSASRGPAAPLLAAVLGQAMTVRLLGVLPAGHVDMMLAAVGRCPQLRDALPAAGLASLFDALAANPVLLNAVSPDHLARALMAVTWTASGRVPEAVVFRLLESMDVYSPNGLHCLPDDWCAYWWNRKK